VVAALRAAGLRPAAFFAGAARFAVVFFAAAARFGAARFAAGLRAAAFFAAGFFAAVARFAGAFFAAAFFGAAFFTALAAVAAFADFFAGFFAAGFFAAAFFGAAFLVAARTAIGCARAVLVSSVVTLLNSLSAVVVYPGRTSSDLGAFGNQLTLHVDRATDALGKYLPGDVARRIALLSEESATHQPYLPFARRFDCT
jgi:hypothetical protein